MSKLETAFFKALGESFKAYSCPGGARSNKKIIPLHGFFANELRNKLGRKYSVKSLGINEGKEHKARGKYYDKSLDVAVILKEKLIATVSIKFVTSNYKQNSNNYFEGLLGETANLRREGVGFAHFLVLRGITPYYSKASGNIKGKEQKKEVLSEKDLQKYVRLFHDIDFPHKPDILGIGLVDINEENCSVRFSDHKQFGLSNQTLKCLKKDFSLASFMKKFVSLVHLKS